DGREADEDPPAQLLQVIEEAHPGQFVFVVGRVLLGVRQPPGNQLAQAGWIGCESTFGAVSTEGSGGGVSTGRGPDGVCAIVSLTEATSVFACSISVSIVLFRSSEARLNSASPLPIDFPISGSFLGPKTRSATMKIKINSGIPMGPNMFPPRRILRPRGSGGPQGPRSGHSSARERNAYDFGRGRVRMGRSGEEDLLTQPRSRLFIALALLAAATLVGGTIGGRLLASPARETPSLDEYADILTTLSEWAPEPMGPEKFVYASIHGMLARLDPHTAFLEPDDYTAMREKQAGSFFGLGIQIQKRMGKITVL